ncbi:MAG: hypothetical protein R3C49_24120 [Planctomycetaceae bacterium]
MIRQLQAITLCLLTTSAVAVAQQPHHSEVIVGHPGVTALKDDIRYLMSLATAEERKQQQNIIDFVELLELGLDLQRPLRVDLLTGTNPPGYIISAGYVDPVQDLLDNLDGSGFVLKKIDASLSELLPPDTGWFRLLPGTKEAILVFTKPADHMLLRQVIQRMSEPLKAVAPVIAGNASIGIQLHNRQQTPADQKLRRDSFGEIRAVEMDSLQQRPSETATQFALRKKGVSVQLDEIERLLAEANSASAVIHLDRKAHHATVTFKADAIAGSSFAKSMDEFGSHPDVFASVPRAEGSVLSVRGNYALDELRQKNGVETTQLMEQDAAARLAANKTLSASEKAASEKLVKGLMQFTRDSIASGAINGFAESIPNPKGDFTSWGAIAVKDGKKLNDLLALISETGKGNVFKGNVATVGDVTIHQVQFAEGYFQPFDLLFENKAGYIGVSDQIIWIGTGGPESLEPMKAAIQNLKEPAAAETVLSIEGNLLMWSKRAKRLLEEAPPLKSADEQTKRRDRLRYLGTAVEAFATLDDARFTMTVKDGKAHGEIFVNRGVLTFIGRMLADYSKNHLE